MKLSFYIFEVFFAFFKKIFNFRDSYILLMLIMIGGAILQISEIKLTPV